VKSPCVNVCVIDPMDGLCKGCARSLEEIARWASMDDDERDAILQQLKSRKRARASDVAKVPVPPLS
jgi:predicted Fe-S protein YdhL (DUF1289 family)